MSKSYWPFRDTIGNADETPAYFHISADSTINAVGDKVGSVLGNSDVQVLTSLADGTNFYRRTKIYRLA